MNNLIESSGRNNPVYPVNSGIAQRVTLFTLLILFLTSSLSTSLAIAQDAQPPKPSPNVSSEDSKASAKDSQVIKISEGVYKIGNVVVDQNKEELYAEGSINMERGLIEYLAVAEKGKLHESVLKLDVEPIHFQTGLLLLGLKYGRSLKFQGDPAVPSGDLVEIWVEWVSDGVKKKVRGEDLLFNYKKEKTMEHTNWVFSGSLEVDGMFVAQVERSLISTYHDPSAIVDNPLPEGADDTILYANEKLVPPVGTLVKLTVKAAKSRGK